MTSPDPPHAAGVLDAIPDLISRHDREGRYLYINRAMEEAIGLSRDQVVGRTWDALPVRESLKRAWQTNIAEVFESGSERTGAFAYPTPSGWRRYTTRLVPERDAAGAIVSVLSVAADVTELQEALERSQAAERAMGESEATLRAVFESVPGGLVLLDQAGNVMRVSMGSLSRSPGRLGGAMKEDEPFSAAFPPEVRAGIDELVRAALLGTETSLDQRLVTPSGESLTFEVTYVPVRSGDEIIGAAVIGHDVTRDRERQRAVAELAAIVGSSPDAIVARDPDGKVISWNPGAERLYGYTRDEAVALGPGNLTAPEQAASARGRFHEVWVEGKSLHFETERVRKDGTRFTASMTLFPVRDDDGNVIASASISRDVTLEKAAEEQIARLAAIVASSPDAIIARDTTGKVVAWNPGAEQLYGYTADEALGQELGVLAAPGDAAASRERLALITESGTPVSYEVQRMRKDGRVIHVSITTFPIRDVQGNAIGTASISRDVTSQKDAEAQLRLSNERYELAARATNNAIWDWQVTTGQLDWGDGLYSLFGYEPGDVEPTIEGWAVRIHPDDRERVVGSIEATVRSDGQAWVEQYQFRRKDGTYADVLDRGYVLRDESRAALRMIGAMMDITDRQQSEAALRESEGRFRAVLATVATGIWIWDGEGMSYVNEALSRITGYTVEELQQPHFFDSHIVHPDDQEMIQSRGDARIRGEAVPNVYELRVVRPTGEVRTLEVTATIILLDGKRVSLASAFDLTERKTAEEERRRFDQQVQDGQKLESLGILAGGIAHDFNNLLVGIMGNAGLAMMEIPPDSPARRTITDIETAARRAGDLTRQMLAYSGKGKFVVETVDLSEVAREMVSLLEVSISKRATLHADFAEGLPAVTADATQLRQVIMNLITNASDALGDNEGEITIRTALVRAGRDELGVPLPDTELTEGDYLLLEVRDTGEGMDPETQARIFEPFFTTKFTGRGLGLAAVQGIVRGHNGVVRVESERGAGTRFRVYLPPAEAPVLAKPEHSGPLSAGAAAGSLVLVVDDDESVRQVTSRMLQTAGFRAMTAADGREAVALYSEHHAEIAAVILDLTMPVMDGEETFRAMRAIDPGARVILISGYTEQDATAGFTGQALAGFLQKPFRHPDLIERVTQAVASPR